MQKGDNNKAFLSTFDAMEEGVDYELTSDAFSELNKARSAHGYRSVKPFVFQRKGGALIVDWKDNDWGIDTVKVDRDNPIFVFTFAAVVALALAIAENRIQRVETTCEGKVVEIEGIRYRLVKE